MSSFFSSDGSFSLQFAIIFAVIFLILAAGVFLLRRFTGGNSGLSNRTPPRGRQPRLGIVDIYELDRQRQLILLRRDNVEHLLLVGGPNDVVVERNITRGINARLAAEEPAYDDGSEPASAVTPVQRPPEPIASYAGPVSGYAPNPALPPASSYSGPSFEMPVVLPVSVSSSATAVSAGARPLDLPPRSQPGQDLRDEAPRSQGARSQELRTPEPAEARPQKESALARVIRRAPPSLANLVPAAFADRIRGTDPTPPAPPAPGLSSAPVVSPPTARAIDAAILSDMARQLEEALRRPAAAVRPALPAMSDPGLSDPGLSDPISTDSPRLDPILPSPMPSALPPAEPDGEPSHETVAPNADDALAVDPVAAAMAAATQDPPPVEPVTEVSVDEAPPALTAGGGAETVPGEAAVEPSAPEPDRTPVDAPVVQAAIADAPSPAAIDPPPFLSPAPAVPASDAAPVPKPAASPNPFSVEEIEAEFARLLGRPLDRKS